jgi:site-specific recombinase XerD
MNPSDNTIASYLEGPRQAERFLATRGHTLTDARRTDLEAFLADLLARRSASTVATRHKVLRILYQWLEEEDEVEQNPMARVRPPIVPEQPVPIVPEEGLRRLLAALRRQDLRCPPRYRHPHVPAGHRRPPSRVGRPMRG